MTKHTGISNRRSPREEAEDRRQHPREPVGDPGPEDASGRPGDDAGLEEVEAHVLGEGHTSHKSGSRSGAQKRAGSRHADNTAPSAHKEPGASGEELGDEGEREDEDE